MTATPTDTRQTLQQIDRALAGDILERVFPTQQLDHTPGFSDDDGFTHCACGGEFPPIYSEYTRNALNAKDAESLARAGLARSVMQHTPDNDQLETADGRIMTWNGREYENLDLGPIRGQSLNLIAVDEITVYRERQEDTAE